MTAYVSRPHDYDKPPPGQGSAREAICKACGVRRSVAGDHSECTGRHPAAATETVHDYDPYAF